MVLIKENKEKHRSVFFDGENYVKVWGNTTPQWISEHVSILNELVPNYVIEYGGNWIKFKTVQGTPASEFDHTEEFINRVYNFCLEQIEKTLPYAHGDWVLSNIIIKEDSMFMVNWDNVGIYPKEEIYKKLHNDLKSAFGEKYKYDTTVV